MGIFDIFKKKEEKTYDPTDLKITEMDVGFIVDYDLKTWQVKAVGEYDWGNNNYSLEYKLDSGDEVIFLEVEDDDELVLKVNKKLKIRSIDEDLPERIVKKERPPKKLEYQGTTYYKDDESHGYYKDRAKKTDDWDEFISWDYYDKEEQQVLCTEQWGDREFEASIGKLAKEFEFSNILPSSSE